MIWRIIALVTNSLCLTLTVWVLIYNVLGETIAQRWFEFLMVILLGISTLHLMGVLK